MRATPLALVAGFVCGISFLTPLWFAASIGFAVFLCALTKSNTHVKHTLLFVSLVQGLAYFGMYFHTVPLPWLSDAPLVLHIVYVGTAWLFTVTLATIPFGIWSMAYAKCATSKIHIQLLVLPSAWVLAEWLSGTLISFGTKASFTEVLSPISTVGFLGNQLADHVLLLQTATLGGVYILSFITVAIALVFVHASQHTALPGKHQLAIVLLAVCVLAASSLLYFSPDLKNPGLKVTLVTTYTRPLSQISSQERREADHKIMSILSANPADIILLPEATEFLKRNRDTLATVLAQGTSTPIIVDSESMRTGITRVRRGEFFDPSVGASVFSGKEFLVPFGEYMPSFIGKIMSVLVPQFAEVVGKDRVYVSSPHTNFTMKNGTSVSLRMCNEVVNDELYRRDAHAGAHIFLNSAAHSWYKDSHVVERQILRAAKIRAAENRRYLALANNGAPSFAVDWFGQLIAQSSWHSEEPLTVLVRTSSDKTPYSRYGSAVLCGALTLLTLGLALARLRNHTQP